MNPRVLYRAATYAADARSTADSVISALTPAAWYRNATGVTESGGFASQWDDYSGNARHLVQGTGTNQPAYSAGVLTFDGADNFMRAAFAINQPVTVYLVVNVVSWTVNKTIFDGAAALNRMRCYLTTSTPRFSLYAGSAACENSGLTVGAYGIIAAVYNNASSSSRVNNNAAVTGTVGSGSPGGITLGGDGQATPLTYANIGVKEMVAFGAAHNGATQDSVITALNNALTVF